MNNAISLFVYIWQKIITLMFGTFEVAPFVTIGWIVLIVSVIGMIIRSILHLPIGVFTNSVTTTQVINKGDTTRSQRLDGGIHTESRSTSITRTRGRGRV